jgi:hypothetical protein
MINEKLKSEDSIADCRLPIHEKTTYETNNIHNSGNDHLYELPQG